MTRDGVLKQAYSETWEVNHVLEYFDKLPDNIGLKTLYKLVLLLAILSGQRWQTLHLLDIKLTI